MDRWLGKTAVVTGASGGIGAAAALTLADAGLKVIGLARRPNLIDDLKPKVKGKGSIVSRACDVSKPDQVADAFKWIESTQGTVHVLVNNAGYLVMGTLTDMGESMLTDDDIATTLDINVKGLVLCARHAISSMKKGKVDGHIVNINSIAGHYIPSLSLFNVYPGSKHAVSAVTETLRNELALSKSKIKITSLSPGLVITDMVKGLNVEELEVASRPPALEPQDIADAVLYVVSTPANVNISELTVQPVGERKL